MANIREQMKHNRTQEVTAETVHAMQEHRNAIVAALIGAIVVAGIIIGIYTYFQRQNDIASAALGHAMRTYETPITPAGAPAQPNTPSFSSVTERDKAAGGEFEGIAGKYPHTTAGRYALYMAGVVQLDSGDSAAAEKTFTRAKDEGDARVSSLAKLGLANIYISQNQNEQVVKTLKDLIDHPSAAVPKTEGQMELADFYIAHNQNADAAKIYQQIANDEAKTPIGQFASGKAAELSKPAK